MALDLKVTGLNGFKTQLCISMCLFINVELSVTLQRLCENVAKLGSKGDIAGTRPILKELQAVLQR